MKAPAELGSLMPAVFEVLGRLKFGVYIVAQRADHFELWYANSAGAELLGYSLADMMAFDALDLIVPEQRPLIRQLATSFRAGQPIPPTMEVALQHKDGNAVPLEFTLGLAWLGDTLVYISLAREVGENGPSQLSLLEADRIGLVGALSAGFAHEINNPLTSVLLNLRSMRKQLHNNMPAPSVVPAVRCLDDITAGAERIASNVRALQTLATRSDSRPVDLAAVVSSALRLATPTLEPRAHVIRQIFPVSPVLGEESRIGQAVLSMMLFSSSGFESESTNPSNRIVVSVEERAGEVIVQVSDNGRDLTAEEARRAFDPFFRSPARGAGVGVGLGVARSVATTLGGEVTLAPRTGGGVVITMRLPASPG